MKRPSTKSELSSSRTAKPARLTRAQRTALLKALADPKRFELLERISRAACPLACAVAGEALAISPATLSHHIKELQTSGLIDVRREGKFALPHHQTGSAGSPRHYPPVPQHCLLPHPLNDAPKILTRFLNPSALLLINSIVVETSK